MTEPRAAIVTRDGLRDLAVDIYAPTTVSLESCVILLHGGGWMFGDRKDMAAHARELAGHGFTAIAAEYRLSREAIWPAQQRDAADVVAWARREARGLGFSPDRIALLGVSAGGHIALMASRHAAAVVALCAPPALPLPPPGADPDPIAFLLGPDATEVTARDASPLSHVSETHPPTLLVAAGRDHLIPCAAHWALFSALQAAGVHADLRIYDGHAHAFDALPSMLGPVQADVALFLRRVMVDPARYRHESETMNPFARPGGPIPPGLPRQPAPVP